MRLQELWKRWCIMLFTIVHQCSHSYKQAYWHSNASLRPALTEYWLIITNHKGKQTDVMDLWSPPRRNLVQTTCIWTMRSLSYQRKRQETNWGETGITKMAMRTRYDVLRYSRTTWVICACVLLHKYNQRKSESKSYNPLINGSHKAEILRRVVDGRSVLLLCWLLRDDWTIKNPQKAKWGKRQATDDQERAVLDPRRDKKMKT